VAHFLKIYTYKKFQIPKRHYASVSPTSKFCTVIMLQPLIYVDQDIRDKPSSQWAEGCDKLQHSEFCHSDCPSCVAILEFIHCVRSLDWFFSPLILLPKEIDTFCEMRLWGFPPQSPSRRSAFYHSTCTYVQFIDKFNEDAEMRKLDEILWCEVRTSFDENFLICAEVVREGQMIHRPTYWYYMHT
jgi:hypothetical protein